MAICKKCRKEIGWITTKGGKRMPIDMYPPVGKKSIKIETAAGAMVDAVPHFATCPYAGDFRGKKQSAATERNA